MEDANQNDLIHAVIRNDKHRVIKLLSQGADVNKENNNGWSPLRTAARIGHADLVKYLVRVGADIDAKNSYDGRTALICATIYRHVTVVKALLNLGANINLTDQRGKSALILATELDHEDIVSLLLEEGANVNATDEDGQTALNLAKKKGHSTIVRLLLDKGADANNVDKVETSMTNDELEFQTDSVKKNSDQGLTTSDVNYETKIEATNKTSNQSQTSLEHELNEVKTKLEKKDLEIKLLNDKISGVEYHVSLLYKALTDQKLRDIDIHAAIGELSNNENVVKPSEIESISKQLFELKKRNTDLSQQVQQLTNDKNEKDEQMKTQQRTINDLQSRLDGMKIEQLPLSDHELVQLKDRIKRVESEILLVQVQGVKASAHFKTKIQLKNLEAEMMAISKKINRLEKADAFEEKMKNLRKTVGGLEQKIRHLGIGVIEKCGKEIPHLDEVIEKDTKHRKKLEMNEIEQEKLLDTIEIFGISSTDGENLQKLVESLSIILGTTTLDVKEVTRLTRRSIQVQFHSIESACSWLDEFKKKTNRNKSDILARNINPSLDKERIYIRQKLTPYNLDIWNQLTNKHTKEKTFGFWIKEGKIFLRLNGQRQVTRIKSIHDIPT